MAGLPEQLFDGRLFHDPAQVHHQYAMTQMSHHGEVVRDEDHGQSLLALQLREQVQDLRLHRDVQRRHRFVAYQDARSRNERACNAAALALTAGQLVREMPSQQVRKADALHHLSHTRHASGLVELRA